MNFNSRVNDFLEDFKHLETTFAQKSFPVIAYLDEYYTIAEKAFFDELENKPPEIRVIKESSDDAEKRYNQTIYSENDKESRFNILDKKMFTSYEQKQEIGKQIADKWSQESEEFNQLFRNISVFPTKIYRTPFGTDVYVANFNGKNGFILAEDTADISRRFVEEKENLKMYFMPFGSSEVTNVTGKPLNDEKKYDVLFTAFGSAQTLENLKRNVKQANELIDFLNTYYDRRLKSIKEEKQQGIKAYDAVTEDNYLKYEDLMSKIREYTKSIWFRDYEDITEEYHAEYYTTMTSGLILKDQKEQTPDLNTPRDFERYYLSGMLKLQRDAIIDFIKKHTDDRYIEQELDNREKLINKLMSNDIKINMSHIPQKIKIDSQNPQKSLKELEKYANDIINQLNEQGKVNLPNAQVKFSDKTQIVSGAYRGNFWADRQEEIEIYINPNLKEVDKDIFVSVLAHEAGHAVYQREVAYNMLFRLSNHEDYKCEKIKGVLCDRSTLPEDAKRFKYFNEMLNLAYSIVNEQYADIVRTQIIGNTVAERTLKISCRPELLDGRADFKTIESQSACDYVGRPSHVIDVLLTVLKLGTEQNFDNLQQAARRIGIEIGDSVYSYDSNKIENLLNNSVNIDTSISTSRKVRN